jgi:hypothetical protein
MLPVVDYDINCEYNAQKEDCGWVTKPERHTAFLGDLAYISGLWVDIYTGLKLFAIKRGLDEVTHEPPVGKPVLFALPTLNKASCPYRHEDTVITI